MTRAEFESITMAHGDPVILMADGRFALCPHFDDTHVLADTYTGNECVTVRIPFAEIVHLNGGALQQIWPKP